MIIYKVTNLKNSKVYIGQTTKNLLSRKTRHYLDAKHKPKENNYFHNALISYEKEDFLWEVIAITDSIEKLNELEIYFIEKYNSSDKQFGYNRKLGGNQGLCSNETKMLLKKRKLEHWQQCSPEVKLNMLNGLKKGTESIKEKYKYFFEERICVCGKTFKCKPFQRKKYCSKECVNKFRNYQKGLNKAILANAEKFLHKDEELILKLNDWILKNSHLILNAKFNNLTFLQDICIYCDIHDIRTFLRIYNLTSKKQFVILLKEKLSKIYADPVRIDGSIHNSDSCDMSENSGSIE